MNTIPTFGLRRHAAASWHGPMRALLALLLMLTLGCGSDGGEGGTGGNTDDTSGALDAGADGNAGGNDAGADAGTDAGDDTGTDTGEGDEKVYAIGVTTIEVVGAAGRKLPVEVWYPAKVAPGAKAATYASGIATSPFGAVRDTAPAEPPAGSKGFPLVIFSHGNGGIREQSVFLTEWLARYGFVVASPEHVGNSIFSMDEKLTAVMPLWRPLDVMATVDHLAKAPSGADPAFFTGLVDTSKYAMMGHSFGGFTTLAIAGLKVRVPPQFNLDCTGDTPPQPVCDEVAKMGPQPWDLHDDRCVVGVPLAPAGYGWQMLDHLDGSEKLPPLVIMGATGDTLTPSGTEQQPVYDDLPGAGALLLIKGSNHYIFSDICALEKVLPASFKAQLGNMCAANTQPSLDEVHAEVADRALAAARLWLLGDTTAAVALTAPAKDWFTFAFKGFAP